MLRKEENKTEDTDSCDPTTSSENETESNSPKMNSADKVDLLSEQTIKTLSETLKTESVKNKTDKRNDEANNNSESNEQQLTQVDDSKKFEELMIDLDSQKKETENLKSVIHSLEKSQIENHAKLCTITEYVMLGCEDSP